MTSTLSNPHAEKVISAAQARLCGREETAKPHAPLPPTRVANIEITDGVLSLWNFATARALGMVA